MSLNSTTLYPSYGINQIGSRFGERWGTLIDQMDMLPASHPYVMAFVLMVRRLRRRIGIKTQGRQHPLCTLNAQEILKLYEGTEDELLHLYYENLREINQTMEGMITRRARWAA